MARHLDLLPGRQPRVDVLDQRVRPVLQARDVGVDLHRRVRRRELAQFDDLALKLGNGAFEIEVSVHGNSCVTARKLGAKRAGKVAMSLRRVKLT